MKILIVSDAANLQLALKIVFERIGNTEIITSNHAKALENFLTEQPEAIIIMEYDDNLDGKGCETYRDIKNSATTEKIIRSGFFELDDSDDYLKIPFELPKLYQMIGIKM